MLGTTRTRTSSSIFRRQVQLLLSCGIHSSPLRSHLSCRLAVCLAPDYCNKSFEVLWERSQLLSMCSVLVRGTRSCKPTPESHATASSPSASSSASSSSPSIQQLLPHLHPQLLSITCPGPSQTVARAFFPLARHEPGSQGHGSVRRGINPKGCKFSANARFAGVADPKPARARSKQRAGAVTNRETHHNL
jgi:hypothetical protein